jgi:hypothetical protein
LRRWSKADIRDRAQAVNYAYRTGLAEPPRQRLGDRQHLTLVRAAM